MVTKTLKKVDSRGSLGQKKIRVNGPIKSLLLMEVSEKKMMKGVVGLLLAFLGFLLGTVMAL